MNTGAVILAAGCLTEQSPPAPMEKLGSVAVLHRIILTFKQAGVDRIAIITGEDGQIPERETAKYGCIFLQNPQYKTTEMLDSAKIGIRHLMPSCKKILLTPADIPFFTADTVRQLLKSQGFASIPLFQGEEGHPVLLSREAAAHILSYEGEGGIREALRKSGRDLDFMEIMDPGALYDGKDFSQQEELLARHNAQLLHPVIQVSLAREQIFFDSQTALLLQLTLDSGSVRIACRQLGISYSKGWKMLNLLESQLGMRIILRHPGGKNGGYTEVSPEGKEFLKRCELLVRRIREEGQRIYQEIFADEHTQ